MYKEIQNGTVAKSYTKKGFLVYEERRKYLVIYEEAVSHILLCNCAIPNFLIYEENFLFFFISVLSTKINVVFKGVDLHVDDMVVSVVADLYVLEAELGEDLLPGLAVDEGGGVHRPAVSDNQNILDHNTPVMFSHQNWLNMD